MVTSNLVLGPSSSIAASWLPRSAVGMCDTCRIIRWWWAGLWQWWSKAGGEVILHRADGERRVVVYQHPLHKGGEKLFRTARWNACLGPLAQAGVIKNTEWAVWIVSKARELNKVQGVSFQRAISLLQAEKFYGGKVHSKNKTKQKSSNSFWPGDFKESRESTKTVF